MKGSPNKTSPCSSYHTSASILAGRALAIVAQTARGLIVPFVLFEPSDTVALLKRRPHHRAHGRTRVAMVDFIVTWILLNLAVYPGLYTH